MNEEIISPMDQLFEVPVYSDAPEAKALYLKALQEELIFHYEHNEMYRKFCERKGFDPHREIADVTEIPPVAVSVFRNWASAWVPCPRRTSSFGSSLPPRPVRRVRSWSIRLPRSGRPRRW